MLAPNDIQNMRTTATEMHRTVRKLQTIHNTAKRLSKDEREALTALATRVYDGAVALEQTARLLAALTDKGVL